jgi:hypothetical protein
MYNAWVCWIAGKGGACSSRWTCRHSAALDGGERALTLGRCCRSGAALAAAPEGLCRVCRGV